MAYYTLTFNQYFYIIFCASLFRPLYEFPFVNWINLTSIWKVCQPFFGVFNFFLTFVINVLNALNSTLSPPQDAKPNDKETKNFNYNNHYLIILSHLAIEKSS